MFVLSSQSISPFSGPLADRLLESYIELLSELHFPSSLLPTEPMTAIAATTIRPAISAYSSTSPPRSSRINRPRNLSIMFLCVCLLRPSLHARDALRCRILTQRRERFVVVKAAGCRDVNG